MQSSVSGIERETVPESETASERVAPSVPIERSVEEPAPEGAGPLITIPVLPSQATEPRATSPATPALPAESFDQSGAEECGDNLCNGLESIQVEPEPAEQDEPVDPEVIEQPPASADAICPPEASADCKEDGGTGVVDNDRGDRARATDDLLEEEDVEPADCDARPWARGCPGPIPEDGDNEAVFRDDGDTDSSDRDVDQSEGVYVPKEVQDELLAPIEKKNAIDDSPGQVR